MHVQEMNHYIILLFLVVIYKHYVACYKELMMVDDGVVIDCGSTTTQICNKGVSHTNSL